MCRLLAVPVLLLTLAALPAQASTIADYVILQAMGLSPLGGTFPDGGTFSGSFSIDESNLPTASQSVALPAVDLITSAPNGDPFGSAIFTSGSLNYLTSFQTPANQTLTEYVLTATTTMNQSNQPVQYVLNLEFVNVTGTFVGGQIVNALELIGPQQSPAYVRIDNSGDALAVDPPSAPEPATCGFAALGLLALPFLRRRRS